jgi:hypothetical protein
MSCRKTDIKIDLYGSIVHVYFCDDVTKTMKRIAGKKTKLDIPASDVAAWVTTNYQSYPGEYWILLQKDCSVGDISHEALHVVIRILDEHDIKYTIESEETYAYFLGHLTDKIYNLKLKLCSTLVSL